MDFVDLNNVCLDTETVILPHLEDNIYINVYLVAPHVRGRSHLGYPTSKSTGAFNDYQIFVRNGFLNSAHNSTIGTTNGAFGQ